MGVFENPTFAKSTRELYGKIAKTKARTLAGGGETIVALNEYKLSRKINYISTGGGAMLTYIEGAQMPGIEIIPKV
jgi:phosphoglycerate kinase